MSEADVVVPFDENSRSIIIIIIIIIIILSFSFLLLGFRLVHFNMLPNISMSMFLSLFLSYHLALKPKQCPFSIAIALYLIVFECASSDIFV
jgi:hypothetical protein